MKAWSRVFLALWLCFAPLLANADSKVFTLNHSQPEQVLQTLRNLYGDKVRADLIQHRLVVVGSSSDIAEISRLLAQLDKSPQGLRLTLREQPPAESSADSVVYSSGHDGLSIDTVAGALVTLERAQITQQPTSNGWMIAIDNVPTEFSSIMLQVQLQGQSGVQVLVSYAKQEHQQRRVFGNTISGRIGEWLPLLPRRETAGADDGSVTYETGPKPGSQLYLRIENKQNSQAL